jgi:hypothetical protein
MIFCYAGVGLKLKNWTNLIPWIPQYWSNRQLLGIPLTRIKYFDLVCVKIEVLVNVMQQLHVYFNMIVVAIALLFICQHAQITSVQRRKVKKIR